MAIGDATEFIVGYYKNSPRPSCELKVRLRLKANTMFAMRYLVCSAPSCWAWTRDTRSSACAIINGLETVGKIVELNGVTVINDTYNASAGVMFAGFEV